MTHAEIIHAIRANIAQVIVGRQAAVDLLLAEKILELRGEMF